MNRRYIWLLAIAVAILTVPLVVPPASAQAADTPWPMFHANPQHTGVGIGTAPTNLAVKWSANLNAPIISSPVVAYGKVYVGSEDKNIYCLDASTGNVVWKYATSYYIRSSPAVANNKVYVGPDDGNIYCLDASTGTLVWKYAASSLITPTFAISIMPLQSSPTIVGDKLYVGHFDAYIYCMNANNGSVVWKRATKGAVESSPSVSSTGKVYCGSNDGTVYCLNANDGSILWTFDTTKNYIGTGTRSVVGSGCIIEDLNMVVYFTETNGIYYAFDMNTGAVKWTYAIMRRRPYTLDQNTQARAVVTPAYSKATGSIYCTDDDLAQRIDVNTGKPKWMGFGNGPGLWNIPYPLQTPPAGSKVNVSDGMVSGLGYSDAATPTSLGFVNAASPAVADGKVYFGSHRGSLFCFDANSVDMGVRNSWYQIGGWIDCSPAIAYGNVFVGTTQWKLYCFQEGTPRALDPTDKTKTLPLLDATSITGTLSAPEVKVDDWIYVTGKITYKTGAKIWERALVFADFVRPDGTKWKANMMADWDGTYKIPFRPDMEGTWIVKPRWIGDTYNAGSQGPTLTFTVTSASSSPTASQTSSVPTIIGILAAPALVAMPIAAVLHKRKTK